jgi:hypothetical protein
MWTQFGGGSCPARTAGAHLYGMPIADESALASAGDTSVTVARWVLSWRPCVCMHEGDGGRYRGGRALMCTKGVRMDPSANGGFGGQWRRCAGGTCSQIQIACLHVAGIDPARDCLALLGNGVRMLWREAGVRSRLRPQGLSLYAELRKYVMGVTLEGDVESAGRSPW